MENIGLTIVERKILEKRGFYIKDGFWIENLIDIFVHFLWLSMLYMAWCWLFFMSIAFSFNLLWILYFILTPILFTWFTFFRSVVYYIGMWKFFYSTDTEIIFWKAEKDNFNREKLDKLYKSYAKVASIKNINWNDTITKILKNILIVLIFIIWLIAILKLKWLVLILIVPIFGIPLIIATLAKIYQYFNPLYAFGNLGEKIQKLTPQIATQSKAIEENFASDISYSVLSDGFDGLASTFAQIVSLVIRLEKVEARANKGNLFDSAKYIGSLRSDIVWPLRSLRGFLETKRTELMSTQQELSRIRIQVGGTSENRDLASARTEPLMIELTENIEKLDIMIEKMG